MKKFGKNKDAIFAHFMKENGGKKDDAMAKTIAHMNEIEADRETSLGAFDTAVDSSIDTIKKSVASLNAVVTKIDGFQTSVAAVDVELKKSVADMAANPAEYDGSKFIAQTASAIVTSAANQNAVNTDLAKSIAQLAEGIADAFTLLKSINANVMEATEQAVDAAESARYVARGLRKSQAGITTDVTGLEAEEATKSEKPETLAKSINAKAAQNFLVDRGIETQATPEISKPYFEAAEAIRLQGRVAVDKLSKSILGELVVAFPVQK